MGKSFYLIHIQPQSGSQLWTIFVKYLLLSRSTSMDLQFCRKRHLSGSGRKIWFRKTIKIIRGTIKDPKILKADYHSRNHLWYRTINSRTIPHWLDIVQNLEIVIWKHIRRYHVESLPFPTITDDSWALCSYADATGCRTLGEDPSQSSGWALRRRGTSVSHSQRLKFVLRRICSNSVFPESHTQIVRVTSLQRAGLRYC